MHRLCQPVFRHFEQELATSFDNDDDDDTLVNAIDDDDDDAQWRRYLPQCSTSQLSLAVSSSLAISTKNGHLQPVSPLALVCKRVSILTFYDPPSLVVPVAPKKGQRIPPWYPTHPERDLYVSLLNQTEPKVSDALLKAALIRRAIADVRRVVKLREDKPALQNLLQKGSVGDDLWNSLLAAEKELEAELVEVIHEANSFVPGWGQLIFQTAGEMVQNEKMRKTFEELHEVREKQGEFCSRDLQLAHSHCDRLQ